MGVLSVKQQPRAGPLEDRSPATEAGNGDVTCLMGKEPELVHDVERYWLDTVEFTSTHSMKQKFRWEFGEAMEKRLWKAVLYRQCVQCR